MLSEQPSNVVGIAVKSARILHAFKTGGATTDRYTLNSVVFSIHSSSTGQLDVSIHNASGSNPGTKIGSSLTGTIATGGGNTTYTASGITLSGDTTYFVRASRSGSTGHPRFLTVTSNSEDGTSTSGWTIADNALRSTNSGTSWSAWGGTGPGGASLRFTVNATTVAATPKLTPSGITQTGATLTIENRTGAWWYKRTAPTSGACTSRTSSQTTASLSSLTAGTSYTYKAYSASGCSTANEIATASFATPSTANVTLSAGSITQTTAVLTIANHNGGLVLQEHRERRIVQQRGRRGQVHGGAVEPDRGHRVHLQGVFEQHLRDGVDERHDGRGVHHGAGGADGRERRSGQRAGGGELYPAHGRDGLRLPAEDAGPAARAPRPATATGRRSRPIPGWAASS